MDKWEVEGALGVDMKTGERGNYAIRIGNFRLVPFNGRLPRKDAYLIAAAPDLLAACEAALRLLDNVRSVHYRNGASMGGVFSEVEQLREAIKLAREGNSGVNG